MAVVTGIAITKTGSYRWTVWTAWTLATLGLGLTILMDVDTTIPQWVFINIVPGLGLGILFPSLQFVVQAATTSKDMAFAVGAFTFFRTFGQAVGVAIGGAIFQNQMIQKLQAYPRWAGQAGDLAKDAAALVEIIRAMPAGTDKLELQTAYTDSIRTIYIVLTALCGVGLVTSAFVRAYDINVALETDHGLVQKAKDPVVKMEQQA